jgi:hypothetical protein
MKKDAVESIISRPADAAPSSAPVLANRPAGAGNELATSFASFANEYKELDCAIKDLTTELLEQDRKLAGRFENELIPLLNNSLTPLWPAGDSEEAQNRIGGELPVIQGAPG